MSQQYPSDLAGL